MDRAYGYMSLWSQRDYHQVGTDLAPHQSVAVDVAVGAGHDPTPLVDHHVALLMLMRTHLAERSSGVWQHEYNEEDERGQSRHTEV